MDDQRIDYVLALGTCLASDALRGSYLGDWSSGHADGMTTGVWTYATRKEGSSKVRTKTANPHPTIPITPTQIGLAGRVRAYGLHTRVEQ